MSKKSNIHNQKEPDDEADRSEKQRAEDTENEKKLDPAYNKKCKPASKLRRTLAKKRA